MEESGTVVPSLAPKTYNFDEDFQKKIVNFCLRDVGFLRRTDGLIHPSYFENEYDGIIVNLASKYYKDYKGCLADKTTLTKYIGDAVGKRIIRKEDIKNVVERLNEISTASTTDKDYVIESISTFARHQAVANAIMEAVEKHLDINNFDKIQDGLNKALQVGAQADNASYDYGANIQARTNIRNEIAMGKSPATGISTGYPDLDKYLQPHRGWGKKELSVLMGPAKVGKSTALIDFGLSACSHIHRYNVLYVTLEVSKEIIADRADSHIAKIATSELQTRSTSVRQAVEEWSKKAGHFIIEERPTGSMRVSDLRRLLDKFKGEGLQFDLVIVDYADLMIPERYSKDSIENSKSVWVDLRGLAVSEEIAILTATQTNRAGATKMVAEATDVAEDFNKIRIADTVISINKTPDEARMNQCRLYLAAIRNAKSGFSIRINQNIESMQFITGVEGVE